MRKETKTCVWCGNEYPADSKRPWHCSSDCVYADLDDLEDDSPYISPVFAWCYRD